MKKNFKKIMSLVLTVLMLVGTFSALIPMTASAEGETITLTPNADNWINGQNYRLETSSSDTYAKIENGKLYLKMASGDLFWIPSLTVKDTTSSYTFENMLCADNDEYIQFANGVATGTNMYGSGIGGYNWKGYNWKWNTSGAILSNTNYIFNDGNGDSQAVNWGGTNSQGAGKDAIWNSNEALSVRTTFDTWADVVPTTHFYEGQASLDGVGSSDMRLRWYPHAGTCVGKSFGIICSSGSGATFTVDKITATNMNETASFVETFDIQAEPKPVIDLVPNADNWINGQNYRLETSKTDGSTYARIEDGKLYLKMAKGDLFWIPSLTVKDITSSYTFENLLCSDNDEYIQFASGVERGTNMYGTGVGGYNWKAYNWKWNSSGAILSEANYIFNDGNGDTQAENWGGTKSEGAGKDAIWGSNEALSVRTTFDTWADVVPTTHFYEGQASLDGVGSSDMRLRWYPHAGTCVGKSFGIICSSGSGATFTVDKITATNMNEAASYTETFDEIDTTKPACISDAMVNLSLDGVIGLNFTFNASATTPADATVVATMNGETVATADVVEGANTVTVPVTAKEMIDDVNFAIKVNGELFEEQSYTTSVAKYAAELKKDAEWAELMDAMLKYGAAAQLLLDYKADNLAADVNGVTYDFSDYEAIDYEGNTSLLKGLYVNLTLEADTTLKLYFKPADDVTLNVTVNGEAATVVDNGDGYYVVAIDGIAADKLLEDVFVVVNGDLTFYISALDWAKVASESDDANVAIVANALAAYGDAASKKA